MVGCIALSLAQLIGRAAPEWGGALGPVLAFLYSLEAIHSQRLSTRRLAHDRDRTRFHLVEAVVLLLLARFALYALPGAPRLVDDLARWPSDLGAFITVPYLALVVVLALFWAGSFVISKAFQELEASVFEQAPPITDPRYDLWLTGAGHRRTDRQALLRAISGTFAGGGLVMLVLTALARVDLRALATLQHTRNSDVIFYAVVYFALGFVLISQAQYATLKANWQLERIPIKSPVGRRWLLLGVLFMLLVVAVASLLPVTYSANLLYAAAQFVVSALARIAGLLILLVTMVSALLARLLGQEQSAPPQTAPTPAPAPEELVPLVPHEPLVWWQVARSVLFWVVLIGIVGYSLYHFVGDHWGIWPRLRVSRLFVWLGCWVRGLRCAGRHAAERLRVAVARRLSVRREGQTRRPGYLALGRLDPRERVRYFYLSIVERGARQGIVRPPGATPLEYEAQLEAALPEASADIKRLTQAFLEARYSARTLTRADEQPVRLWWQRVKQALLLRRRAAAPPASPEAGRSKGRP